MPIEDEIWRSYAKGVKRIAKSKSVAPPSPLASSRRRPGSSLPIHHEPNQPVSIGDNAWTPAFAGMTPVVNAALDRRVERALRQGEIEIEARIDLHGKTLAEAHAALARFMAAAVKTEKRHLLIITGKGKNNAGAIKTALPVWLDALPEAARILALRPAAPKHGGEGAIYVILRRPAAKGRFKA